MAVKVGTFQFSDGGVSGLPFAPKLVLVFSTEQDGFGSIAGDQILVMGYARGVGSPNQRTISLKSRWENFIFFKPQGAVGLRPNEAISDISNFLAPINIARLNLTDDGFYFTATFGLAPALDYGYMAIGGDDVSVVFGTTLSPAAPGLQDVTGLGITPEMLLLVSGYSGDDSTGVWWSQGFVDTAGRQRVSAIHEFGDATSTPAPGSCHRYQSEAECLAMLNEVTGAKEGAAEFVSRAAGTFRLNFTEVPAFQFEYFYIAVQGVAAQVGTLVQPAAPGNQDVTGLDVVPHAILLQSTGQTALDTVEPHFRLSVGVGQVGANYTAWSGDQNGVVDVSSRRNVRGAYSDRAVSAADPTGTGSALETAAGAVTAHGETVGVGGYFRVTWATAAGGPLVFWLALGDPAGVVEPPDDLFTRAGALQGLEGPILWIEFHHPELADPFVISPITIADPVSYYYGLKKARVLRVDKVQLALSDRGGAPQANRFSFTFSDFVEAEQDAPIFRTWLGRLNERAVRQVEIIARMISDRDRRRLRTPFTIFRGRIDEYEGLEGFQTQIDAVSWLEQRLLDPVIDLTVEDLFPEAPPEQRLLTAPLAVGELSDEATGEPGPTIVEDEAGRGSVGEPDPIGGFGDLAVDAPTTVAAVEVPASGNLNLGLAPGNTFYIAATRVVGDVEGQREPFLPAAAIAVTISADGAAIRATCDNDGADAYRFYIGRDYFGVKFQHYLETDDPVTGVLFDEFPALGAESPISTDGRRGNVAQAWAAVVAMLPAGRTAASSLVYLLTTGYLVPVRFAWTAVPDAEYYEVYWRDHPTSAFQRRYIVELDQLNGNGDPYWEGDWSTGGYQIIDGLPVPVGKIMPRYVGKVRDLFGFEWGGFLMSVRPGAFIRAYMGGVAFDEGRWGVDALVPGKAGYTTYFGPDPWYQVGEYRLFMIFLRGPLLEQALASGFSTEATDLPASGATATIGSGDSEVRVTVDAAGEAGNDYFISVVAGVGASQPLLAALVGDTIVVSLATDGGGSPDAAANTAIKVAQTVGAVAGFSAGVTGAGTDPVAPQGATPFGGGTEEGQVPGVEVEGEFRVSFSGCDANDDGTGEPITDLFDQLDLLLTQLGLKDEPALDGAWDRSVVPEFADGAARLDVDSFEQAKADYSQVALGARTGARWIATPITWADLLAEWSLSAYARTAINEDGAVIVAVRNPFGAAVASVGPLLDTLRGTFRWRDSGRGFFTRTPYAFRPVYDAAGQIEFGDTGLIISSSAEREFKERPLDQVQQYAWRDQPGPARQLARATNDATRYPGRVVEVASVLHWLHYPIGRSIGLTHPEGPAVGGYNDRKLQIVGKGIAPDGCTVALLLDDLRSLDGQLSFFEYEEFMAGRWVGGSRLETNLSDGGVDLPAQWFRFRIDWDEIPETHGQQVRVELKRTGAGSITPRIAFDDDGVPAPADVVIDGDPHASSSWAEQVLEIPRPGGGGEVFYWLLPVLAGGALVGDTFMIGFVEGYRV